MDEAFRYCEALVRAHDKDRFIATLFAPPDRRGALYALYAFAIEIAHVRDRVTQPLAGEVRLQWWRDVLTGIASGDEEGNPVAAALKQTRDRFGLFVEPFHALIDARAAELYPEAPPHPAALMTHARETNVAIFYSAVQILDSGAHDELASEAATLHGVSEFLRTSLWNDAVTPLQRRILCEDTLGRIPNLRLLLAQAPVTLAPAYLVLAVDLAILRRALARGADVKSANLAQWRRQWLLWRASRRWPDFLK